MLFSKSKIIYINPILYTYLYLRIREKVSIVWYEIKGALENMLESRRDYLLNGGK